MAARVALLGPYHSPNLGDTAIQMSMIENLRLQRPGVEIVGVSLDANDTARSLGIPAFPLSGMGAYALPARLARATLVLRPLGALSRIRRFLDSVDVLIVSGGGQLDDFHDGAWGHPYHLLVWIALARLSGARVAIVAVGLDRLRSRVSCAFVLAALRLAHYRSFRDAGTLQALRRLGWHGKAAVCPDLALGLRDSAAPAPGGGMLAVLSPISERAWTAPGDARQLAYLERLAAAGAWLHQAGARLRIVCSQHVMDRDAAAQLAALLRARGVTEVETLESITVVQFLGHVREARLVVASRLHAAILSLVAGVPVVAVAALRKVRQLMHDAGLADYCVDLRSDPAEALIARIARALEREGELREQVQHYVRRSRCALAQTYDELGGVIDEACR